MLSESSRRLCSTMRPFLSLVLCGFLGACTVKLGGDDAEAAIGHSPLLNASLRSAGQYRLTRPCDAQLTAIRNRALSGLADMTVQHDVRSEDTWVFAASKEAGTGITASFRCLSAPVSGAATAEELLNVDYKYLAPGSDTAPGGLPQVFRTFLTDVAHQHNEVARNGKK